MKLDPTGSIQWSTLFGGTLNEEAVSVAVDQDSAVYVAGLTDSRDLPVRNAFQARFQSPPCQGDLPCPYDAFVAKLAPDGDRVLYSTYLGGEGGDLARGIDVDDDGNAYVAGSTQSPDFPKVRAFQNTMRGEACGPPPGEPCRQAFLTKLNPSGATAAYSTYLGGREHDDAYGVAVDRQHQAHVTGATQSPDFPTRNALQPTLNNRACTSEQPEEFCDDGFVTKFAANGQDLEYSTYLGGRAEDQGLAIDVTRNGRALVAGRTDSRDFLTTANAAQPDFGGYIDGFALQLRRNGTPVWSTFLGGTDADRATGIAADKNGTPTSPGGPSPPTSPPGVPSNPPSRTRTTTPSSASSSSPTAARTRPPPPASTSARARPRGSDGSSRVRPPPEIVHQEIDREATHRRGIARRIGLPRLTAVSPPPLSAHHAERGSGTRGRS